MLEVEQSPLEAVQHIIDTDFYDVKGVKMVPLRLIAEQLGYTIKSTGTGAIVSKGAVSYTITRGTTTYGYNKAIRQFEEAPALLEKNKTYVPVKFLKFHCQTLKITVKFYVGFMKKMYRESFHIRPVCFRLSGKLQNPDA